MTRQAAVERQNHVFFPQVTRVAQMCGEEFGRMMENDIETLESELFHSFSDDESAEFIRRNTVLGDSTHFGRDGGNYQYSPDALARRR